MTSLPLIIAACSMAVCGSGLSPQQTLLTRVSTNPPANNKAYSQEEIEAGNYLVSRFAQQHHDWKNAQTHMRAVVDAGIEQEEILRRAMVLSMGAGDPEGAIRAAHKIVNNKKTHNQNLAIPQLFLIAEAIHDKNYKKAIELLKNTPPDATSQFVSPYLKSWAQASLGVLDISGLKENTLQLYHAILISDFLKDHSEIKKTLQRATSVEDIHSDELMRIADLYAHIGEKNKAIELYDMALKQTPNDPTITEHKADLKNGTNKPLFPPVTSVQDGMGRAFGDIATALYQDYNDETARIFANLALYLQPNLKDTKLLLAHIAARHEQYDEAIAYYNTLPPSDDNYTAAQYKIADLLVEADRSNDALAVLEKIIKSKGDVEAQIRIGDIHRRTESFGQALTAYNTAVKMMGGKIPPEYWHLYYVRGMAQEQIGNWDKAEIDLKAALALQPDHPYILNYLGYAWADRGVNLDEAQKMIARAVELRPTDGYIMDSLGWVKYKVKDYEGAAPILERAVALMPYDPTINDHLGDAYWKVGRQREARFQWERARNHSEDPAVIKKITDKIENGLRDEPAVAGIRE